MSYIKYVNLKNIYITVNFTNCDVINTVSQNKNIFVKSMFM